MPSKWVMEKYAPFVARIKAGEKTAAVALEAGIAASHLRYLCRHSGVGGQGRTGPLAQYESVRWDGKIADGPRCRCGLLLPCHDCLPANVYDIPCKTSHWE